MGVGPRWWGQSTTIGFKVFSFATPKVSFFLFRFFALRGVVWSIEGGKG